MLDARPFRTFRWLAAFVPWLAASPVAATNYEVGPGRVLRGLLKRIDRKLACEGVGE